MRDQNIGTIKHVYPNQQSKINRNSEIKFT